MSKRQGGRPKEVNDFYPTPKSAVLPLIPFLPDGLRYYEPCAGAGDLIKHLDGDGRMCVGACDIAPRADFIEQRDCLKLLYADIKFVDVFITNPPHTHELLAPIIDHLVKYRPTWLLLPHDWIATKQASPFLDYCSHIKVIGRMKIYPGSPSTGFDNFVWARFTNQFTNTKFVGRDF